MDARQSLKEVIKILQNGENRSYHFTYLEGCLMLREGRAGYHYGIEGMEKPTLLHICNPTACYKQMVKGGKIHPYIGTVNLETRACRRCGRLAPEHVTKRVYILKRIHSVPAL